MVDTELFVAAQVVGEWFTSPVAGPYASDVPVLKGENNVGGANIGIPLPHSIQRYVLEVTEKDFTGLIRQLQVGENVDFCGSATSLTFNTGSIEIMGARSADLVRLVIHKLCELFEKYGLCPDICYMSIDNKVTSGALGYCVSMERIHKSLPGFETTYEPADFPGIICTYNHPSRRVVTFLVFEKGRVMALGIDDIYEASKIFLRLRIMCRDFERDPSSIQQTNASAERSARLLNEDKKRGAGKAVAPRSERIDKEVLKFLEANNAKLNDTDFSAHLDTQLMEIYRGVDATEKRSVDDDTLQESRKKSRPDEDDPVVVKKEKNHSH